MKHVKKCRVLSFALAVMMSVSLFSASVFASEIQGETGSVGEEVLAGSTETTNTAALTEASVAAKSDAEKEQLSEEQPAESTENEQTAGEDIEKAGDDTETDGTREDEMAAEETDPDENAADENTEDENTADEAGSDENTADEATEATEDENAAADENAAEKETVQSTLDRLHFISLGDSDSILVESNGLYGLIDTGHPSATSAANAYSDLSSTINNGLKVVKYLLSVGVKHLSFLMTTHNHSDHIGGVADIADSLNADSEYFIDDSTVYIYKEYTAIKNEEETGKYLYEQAISAMQRRNAVLLNTKSPSQEALEALHAQVNYDASDAIGDNISFDLGDFAFQIFNLYTVSTENENLNSLVTAISKGEQTAVLMADITTGSGTEKPLVKKIADTYNHVDVYKAGHHGYFSTGYFAITKYNPQTIVLTTGNTSEEPPESGNTYFEYYAVTHGIPLYRTSQANTALVAVFGDSAVTFETYNYRGILGISPIRWNPKFTQGWHVWKDSNGSMKWVYIDSTGKALTGWQNISGNWYYMNEDGLTQIGWLDVSGNRYYMDSKGVMTKGLRTIDGKVYYFGSNGRMQTGWLTVGGKQYIFQKDGAAYTGWYKSKKKWNYYGANGAKAINSWQYIDGHWYRFNSSGNMLTGKQKISGKWYYFNSNGMMYTGWKKSGGKWYYYKSNGVMATGWQTIDRKTYYFKSSGKMVTGKYKIGKKKYVFNKKGELVK